MKFKFHPVEEDLLKKYSENQEWESTDAIKIIKSIQTENDIYDVIKEETESNDQSDKRSSNNIWWKKPCIDEYDNW